MDNIPARLTRHYAETRGYTVDSHCYPWFAYKGERFSPTRKFQVYTDIEAVFLADKCDAAVAALKKNTSFFVDEMHPVQVELDKGGNVGSMYLALRAHVEDSAKQCEHLKNYKVNNWEFDGNAAGKACFKANLWRAVGNGDNELVSEIAVSFTDEKARVEVSLYRQGNLTLSLFDNTTRFQLEPSLEFISFDALMYIASSEADRQLEYALAQQ